MPPGDKPLPIKALLAGVVAISVLIAVALVVTIVIPAWKRQQEGNAKQQRQWECRNNLKSAYTAARAFRQTTDSVTADFKKLEFDPGPGNRYLYVADATVGLRRADPKFGLINGDGLAVIAEVVEIGVSGTCPQCELTLACAGNVDTDDTLDVWSISTGDRVGPTGLIPKGVAFNHVDDVTNHRLSERVLFPTP